MNKHIYIYSPSGAVRDKAAFKRGVARLESLGHDVEVDAAALASHLRFAGDDDTRLAAIHRAAASGADVALISRGGYGLTRILPGIHYKAVAKAIDQGMRFVGISDFTAFQGAVLAKTGRVTWAGPGLCEGFGVGGKQGTADGQLTPPALVPDDIMEACFDDLINGQGEGTGWRQGREPVSIAASQLPEDEKLIANKAISTRATASFGINKSVLWGGNLSVLVSLLGTPYFPEVKGGILFLEDVAEHPYRIERMLTQLLHAGVLARQKAILLGQFTEFKLVPHDRGYKLQTVVNWLRQQIKTPVLTNLPYGHVATKVLLPMGAKTDLIVQGRDALLFWGHA
ncbi:MAG: LD-carboxypeptidase [Gammaproteobacteria bacterium]|uniref:LD-carboxypeptidase n=1 Tax=Rhodoferax sp. TaxID=50421 RepID=UPI00183B3FCF|nr:LD-carboxypeptidase [Rhodoferax sp.]MBU3899556.1 LD-carboxypeptidase [Gammaproteobacteria bacterium]MBA3059628.1 LD-carboxypeptidase [Rhodoferax sp.]MBU3997075.1 LD-carboxypeptidase [Gammaproteobacteria bacterium]MBU4018032.1 LD-carboxypeptidase [Gammaproteobacteria bacterium]MBU4080277.1 LD-carboxypeptidase [Gammaproteobacteria bacterium]